MAIRVERRDKEPIEKLIRRFNKRCEKEDLIKDIRKHEYFESNSIVRRREKRRLEKRIAKERKESD